VAGTVLGVAALALILGLTLRGKDDDGGGGDGPKPNVPVNPYVLVGDLNDQTQVFSGVLQLE
jgi:hypothetical protein